MRFVPSKVAGAFALEVDRVADERGFFARTWCAREFAERGLVAHAEQTSLSHNAAAGTLRGMHYSVAPAAETKVVRCVRGAIHDVLLDVRDGSPTFGAWEAFELSAANGRGLYVPAGVAHGFQTLEPETDVLYQMDVSFDGACARGLRWDDPRFGIAWPEATRIISARDRAYPDFGA